MYKEENPYFTANLLSREQKKICAEEAGVEYRQQGAHDKINFWRTRHNRCISSA